MKRHPAPEILKVTVFAVLFILLSGALVGVGLGQTTSKTLSAEEQELLKAQKANEEAQAEYYREQTKKLHQPPTPGKTFSQSVAENPASVVGVVGTILGAIIVALVSLTTLYYNSRNAIRAQKDSQFYEAMKRMGDKDSPTLRASAAGLLALMAQEEWWKPILSTRRPFLKWEKSKPYFETAVDQLMAGHLLENNRVATESIKNALQQLVPMAPDNIGTITRELYAANLSLQDELASLIAEFFVIRNCQKLPNPDKEEEHDLWDQLRSVTGFKTHSLRKLVKHSPYFGNRYNTYRLIIDTQSTGDRGQLLSVLHDKLQIASGHLRANINLFCIALGRLQPTGLPPMPRILFRFSFKRAFLVDGVIESNANLSNIDFTDANFSGMNFQGVNLASTCLSGASLPLVMTGGSLRSSVLLRAEFGSDWFIDVDMTDAGLAKAKIPKGLGTEWWKANFKTHLFGDEVDSELLEFLYEKNRQSVPTDLNEVHDSVRPFLERKRALESERETTLEEQNR